MTRWFAFAAVMLASIRSGPAAADSLAPNYGGDVAEVAHEVEIRIVDGMVHYQVRRTFENRGDRVEEAELWFRPPLGSVATAMRMLDGNKWLAAKLLDADAARKKYRELTGFGSLGSRGPAIISWISKRLLELELFPIEAGKRRTVEYTLLGPTCYHGGFLAAHYPAAGVSGTDPTVSVKTKGAVVIRPGKPLPSRFSGFEGNVCPETDFAADASVTRIFVPVVKKSPLSARLGSVRVGADVATRIEIDVAPLLQRAPKRARVVFVLDASHSMGPSGIEHQLALARAYVAHLPDATVEIVAYRRAAARLFGRFIAASEFDGEIAKLGKAALEPGNGSELGEGLRGAASIVRGHRGDVRVIAFTDSRLRESFRAAAAIKLLKGAPRGTIVHLVNIPRVHDGHTEIDRNDGHPLAAIATSTGGITVDAHGNEPVTAKAAMLALVRANTIDNFSIEVDGVRRNIGSSATLHEGDAVRLTWVQSRAPSRIVVRGMLWSKPITRRLRVDRTLSRQLPMLLLGSDARRQLTLDQLTQLATDAGAVSERTSLLAFDASVEPNSYDYKDGKLGELSICGHGCGSTSATFNKGVMVAVKKPASAPRPVSDYESILRTQLRPLIRSCAAAHAEGDWDTYVTVETTLDEVVDVDIGSSDNEKLTSCVSEVVWQLRVDRRLAAERGAYELMFGTTAGD